ncbi:MAG: KPN_02809 family neutral zinc metallopeptidase, partial [Longimicrobiales bacterium]
GLAGGGIGAIVITVVALLLGVNPGDMIGNGATAPAPAPGPDGLAADSMGQFVEVVLASTEDTWNELFPREFNSDYPEPTLVLFSGATQSACGFAQAAVGPFYCPLDGSVYIDLGFYGALRDRLGAPGDFAQAYVIAHEVGHHVQNVLGVMEQVEGAKQQGGDSNELSVRTELQADCLAGVWAYHGNRQRSFIEPGDVEEALGAAAAVGDDRLQQHAQGAVVPESFTHGSSEQRMRWFRAGLESGDVTRCDTFAADRL